MVFFFGTRSGSRASRVARSWRGVPSLLGWRARARRRPSRSATRWGSAFIRPPCEGASSATSSGASTRSGPPPRRRRSSSSPAGRLLSIPSVRWKVWPVPDLSDRDDAVIRLAAEVAAIDPPDARARALAEAELGIKTKPCGSLGRLEGLAAQIAALRGNGRPGVLEAAIVVAAADHGVAAEGVSAYPQEGTAQMVANFASGGAAGSVPARRAAARLLVVDAGVAGGSVGGWGWPARFGAGPGHFTPGPAVGKGQGV